MDDIHLKLQKPSQVARDGSNLVTDASLDGCRLGEAMCRRAGCESTTPQHSHRHGAEETPTLPQGPDRRWKNNWCESIDACWMWQDEFQAMGGYLYGVGRDRANCKVRCA